MKAGTKIQVPMPYELKRRAKIAALKAGITLEAFVNQAVEFAVTTTEKSENKH